MGRTTQAVGNQPDFDNSPHPDSPAAQEEVEYADASGESEAQEAPQEDGGTTPQTDRSNALRKAYGEATATLREKHRTEFDALYVAAARKQGIDYKPKPTPEQAAEAELAALFTKFPHLKDKVLKDEGVEAQ